MNPGPPSDLQPRRHVGDLAANPWIILILLALANVLNFFDRAIPAILNEAIRREWDLSDLQIGVLVSAVTLVYSLASVPFGRLADNGARRKVLGWGIAVWSVVTSLNGLAGSFPAYLACRLGVGIGEASLTPSAMSLIGDLFGSARRGLATGIFMLGLPLGLMLAFFTVGSLVEAFGTWRAAYLLAGIPGMILAVFLYFIREPRRGDACSRPEDRAGFGEVFGALRAKRTLWWLVASGIAFNIAVFPVNAFLVPLLQRYFHLSLVQAAQSTGIIVGVSGLIGLTLGGRLTDRVHRAWKPGRLAFGAIALLVSSLLLAAALLAPHNGTSLFVVLFAMGWLCSYCFYTCAYPALLDVVEPQMRGTATAIFTTLLYLLGGAFGPVLLGVLSDRLALRAMHQAGATVLGEEFRAIGLHDAMGLAPVMIAIAGLLMLGATRHFRNERETSPGLDVAGSL